MAGMKNKGNGKGFWFGQLLFILSLVFLGIGLFTLGWAVWPTPTDGVEFTIPAGVMPGAPADESFVSLSEYALGVSWPRWMRAGERGTISLTLTDLDFEDTPVVDQPAQVVLVEPAIIGLPVTPPGSVQVNLADQQDLALSWEVEGVLPGKYPGKVYVSFGFYDEELADLVPVPVAVVDVSIRVRTLWGLQVGLAVWFGVVGLVLWGVLFILGRVVQGR